MVFKVTYAVLFVLVTILKNETTAIEINIKTSLPTKQNESINFRSLKHKDYDYMEIEKLPVTPIEDKHKKKMLGMFMDDLITLGHTTQTPLYQRTTPSMTTVKNIMRGHESFMGENSYMRPPEKPMETFYRKSKGRAVVDDSFFTKPLPWVHCHNLITPYAIGTATDTKGDTETISADDPVIIRLLQLLTMDTRSLSKRDIYAIMFQLEKIPVRIYQWRMDAITRFFGSLTTFVYGEALGGVRIDFRSIKKNLKYIFSLWGLDYRNTSCLLAQAKVIRPYCFPDQDYSGSTQSMVRTTIYQKTTAKSVSGECKH